MRDRFRRLILGICAALALVAFSGCTHHEHRKVKVSEEQHEGEVIEQDQGQEMIVE
jgi:outer membrane protein assembly factor BamE (lipoprotein component of BamABCDE complex)